MMTEPIVELRNATKKYAGVPAIENVNFALLPGEIHTLVGENGAGKSTLTKVMAGVVQLTSGQMLINGREARPETPLQALHLGIAMVFQETSLVPTMTVAQNLFLGQEHFFNRLRGIYIAAQQFLQTLQFDVDPTATVSLLGAAKKQMVEIARAVLHKAKVIIFDEPTATLTPEEKKYFFDLVFNLKERGVSVIFISHALEEALLVSDRITVLRDGKVAITDLRENFDRSRIVQAMVGRDLSQTLYGQRKTSVRRGGKRVLSVENLRMAAMVKNNSLSVFAGQITGVFGLVGSGRTETFKVVAGVIKRDIMHGGEILLHDKPVRYLVPAPAVRDGIVYVTEDRKLEGFFETKSISENIYLGLLAKLGGRRKLVSKQEASTVGEQLVKRLNIRAISKGVKAIELSGGNHHL
jgi:ABC-type sugar transport system ATPase subunit